MVKVLRFRPTFLFKVFCALSTLSLGATCMLAGTFYQLMRTSKERDYAHRYEQLGAVIGNSFEQMERMAQKINDNAVRVAYEVERREGDLKTEECLALSRNLGVASIDMIDASGRFIRSPVVPLDLQVNSLFDYCPEYRRLVQGISSYQTTPILPGYPDGKPAKFTMVTNHAGNRILESSIDLAYITEMLRDVMEQDTEVVALGLYAPNGKPLGAVARSDKVAGLTLHSEDVWAENQENNSYAYISRKIAANVKRCCECEYKGVSSGDQDYHYMLRLAVSREGLRQEVRQLQRRCGTLLLAAAGGAIIVAYLLSRRLVGHVVQIGATAGEIVRTDNMTLRVEENESQDEIADLARTVNQMLDALQAGRERAIEAQRLAVLARIAGQVAHDIRSPLTALSVALEEFHKPSEDVRILIRSALYRIQDIANDLLSQNRAASNENMISTGPASTMLSSLVEMLVSEKRTEYRSRLGVIIECKQGANAFGVFVRVDPSQLKRVLSNLINNALDAIPENGSVVIRLSAVAGFAVIGVEDSGIGMAPDVLATLGQEGVSHGKDDGHGIGVHGAISFAAASGGNLRYESNQGEGTVATLRLPIVEAPSWFLGHLDLYGCPTVVVLDDDITIHNVWEERINKAYGQPQKLVHCSTPDQLRSFCARGLDKRKIVFLIDYELLGEAVTGADLIENLGLEDSAVLVTSRFEEAHLVERCKQSKIRLLPKPMALHVPIVVEASTKAPDAILIDDDPLIHRLWSESAQDAGKVFLGFARSRDFFGQAGKLARTTPIFVDSELAESARGEEVAKEIFAMGFQNIYLATAHSRRNFGDMPWIVAVLNKSPPFRKWPLA